MTSHPSHRPVSALRARMIEDMRVRGFTEKTRNDYVRNVRAFAAFIGRSPDEATAEDLRRSATLLGLRFRNTGLNHILGSVMPADRREMSRHCVTAWLASESSP